MEQGVSWTGKRIASLRLYHRGGGGGLPSKGIFSKEHIPFLVFYAWAALQCWQTVGQQYEEALLRAEEEGWELPNSVDHQRTTLNAVLAGVDINAKDAELGVKIAELPSQYMPGFWPLLWLGVGLTLHGLMVLLQVWSVGVKCFIKYRAVRDVDSATHVRVEPKDHTGSNKTLLLPIEQGPLGPCFEFHRRKYVFDPRSNAFVKIRCVVDQSKDFYRSWQGLPSYAAVEHTRQKYGLNKFEMAVPDFGVMYKQQILNPFTIFQLFCTGLWLLEKNWQYSLFTLFMIFGFEATNVWQRVRNMNTLKGMGNKVTPLKVFRCGKWVGITSEELLPGDVFSLTLSKGNDIVPCDCLLLKGSAVLNEATLTGESIPQMKEGMPEAGGPGGEEAVSLKNALHKVHALFGGTKLLSCGTQTTLEDASDDEGEEGEEGEEGAGSEGDRDEDEEEEEGENTSHDDVEETPNGGCLCYVLTTGFSSSQGKLVRMIEGSTENVRSDTKDTALLLLLLLVFAVSASAYVLREGMKEGNKRSKYQLLLHCILIITSVIPPELPMQMALAVNTSLMTLMKMQVFCTEPFRIPGSGKVDTCLFDKTGTLTTDELVAVGIAPRKGVAQRGGGGHRSSNGASASGVSSTGGVGKGKEGGFFGGEGGGGVENSTLLVPMAKAPPEAVLVLGGCHALVMVEGKAAGDPVESAAVKAIKWELPPSGRAQSLAAAVVGKGSTLVRPRGDAVNKQGTAAKGGGTGVGVGGGGGGAAVGDTGGGDAAQQKKVVVETTAPVTPLVVDGAAVPALEIVARHHFSSKLQRMSTVARVVQWQDGQPLKNGCLWVLVKGSPEIIAERLLPSAKPSDYDSRAQALAKEGMRVLALAYKRPKDTQDWDRCASSRAAAESDLLFAGFVAYTCRVRKDTANVVGALVEGAHQVAMVTGDALLTAVHVAKEVGITETTVPPRTAPLKPFVMTKMSPEDRKKLAAQQDKEAETAMAAPLKPPRKGPSSSSSGGGGGDILILGTQSGSSEGGGADAAVGDSKLCWTNYEDGRFMYPFQASEMRRLGKENDLCVTGKMLATALEHQPDTAKHLHTICVYARMTPDEKERVIHFLRAEGRVCLMCGDGANDVGALKSADVGVALLGGFGDLNVERGDEEKKKKEKEDKAAALALAAKGGGGGTALITAEEQRRLLGMKAGELKRKLMEVGVDLAIHPECVEKADLVALYRRAVSRRAVAAHDAKNELDLANMTPQQRKAEARKKAQEAQQEKIALFQAKVAELEAKGESWAAAKAMKAVWAEEKAKVQAKAALARKNNTMENHAARMASMMDDVEETEMPMVKIGDASVAAPFTSKLPSIRGCVDIIRQGRCTLVTSIQMYQILALNCLISAYSLSVLYLEGVKYGDRQMTAQGILMAVSFLSVSRSKPLDKLSSVRPLNSIFHPALIMSILGQFALHMGVMVYLSWSSKAFLPDDYEPDLDGKFQPNLFNSCVFLVGAVQQVSVFVVNLKGAPFMNGLMENRPLLYSLGATFALVFMSASETIPKLNKWLQLEPFPTDQFRTNVLTALGLDFVASLLWDRLMVAIFAPRLLYESMKGTTMKDVMQVVRTLGMCYFIINLLANAEDPDEWERMLAEEEAAAAAAAAGVAGVAVGGEAVGEAVTGALAGAAGGMAVDGGAMRGSGASSGEFTAEALLEQAQMGVRG